MVSVDDVGCLGELSQVVDDANAGGGYLLGGRTESGGINDGPVTSTQQTERNVARDRFRSAAICEPHIREQNDQSVGHPRQLMSVADPVLYGKVRRCSNPAQTWLGRLLAARIFSSHSA